MRIKIKIPKARKNVRVRIKIHNINGEIVVQKESAESRNQNGN